MTTQFTSTRPTTAQPATERHSTMMPAIPQSTRPASGRGPALDHASSTGAGRRIPGEPVDTSFSP